MTVKIKPYNNELIYPRENQSVRCSTYEVSKAIKGTGTQTIRVIKAVCLKMTFIIQDGSFPSLNKLPT